jgi:DNA-binding NtrC family response regulator
LCDSDKLDVSDFPQIASAMGVTPRERLPVSGSPISTNAGASAQPRQISPFALKVTDATNHLRKLEELEGEIIRMAITRYEGRMSEVARRLGIGRSTLYRKLKELGLGDDADEALDEPQDSLRAAGG